MNGTSQEIDKMGAAFPIISAGVGIASGIAGIFSKNTEQRRQQELVNAQLKANASQEAFQYQGIMAQREYMLGQYGNENLQRLQGFDSAVNQYQVAAAQNEGQFAQSQMQLNAQGSQAQTALYQGNAQVNKKQQEFSNQASAVKYANYGELAKGNEQTRQLYGQIEQALAQGNAEYATYLSKILTNEGGMQVSDATQAQASKMGRQEYARILSAFNDAQNVDESFMQRELMSNDFAGLLDDIGAFEGTQARTEINRQIADLMNANVSNQRINNIQYGTNAQALAKSLQMLPNNALIQQGQADLNFLTGLNSLNSQAGSIAAGNAQRTAQLLSQVPPKQSTLGNILNVASAALPLGSLFFNSPAQSNGFLSNNRPNIQLDRPLIQVQKQPYAY